MVSFFLCKKINISKVLQEYYRKIIFLFFLYKIFQLSIKFDIIYIVKIGNLYPKYKEEIMGGPYNIPRNYKGESKILFIFSTKSFLFTIGGAGIGIIFYLFFSLINLKTVGLLFIALLGVLGFIIGTFKIPDNANLSFSRKVGGEAIDAVFLRWIRFKQKNNRIYVYKEEGTKDDK